MREKIIKILKSRTRTAQIAADIEPHVVNAEAIADEICALFPSATGAAEPVAWRWRYKDSKGEWAYADEYPKFASFNLDSMDCEPLYALPPVSGDRADD